MFLYRTSLLRMSGPEARRLFRQRLPSEKAPTLKTQLAETHRIYHFLQSCTRTRSWSSGHFASWVWRASMTTLWPKAAIWSPCKTSEINVNVWIIFMLRLITFTIIYAGFCRWSWFFTFCNNPAPLSDLGKSLFMQLGIICVYPYSATVLLMSIK